MVIMEGTPQMISNSPSVCQLSPWKPTLWASWSTALGHLADCAGHAHAEVPERSVTPLTLASQAPLPEGSGCALLPHGPGAGQEGRAGRGGQPHRCPQQRQVKRTPVGDTCRGFSSGRLWKCCQCIRCRKTSTPAEKQCGWWVQPPWPRHQQPSRRVQQDGPAEQQQ